MNFVRYDPFVLENRLASWEVFHSTTPSPSAAAACRTFLIYFHLKLNISN